MRKIMLLVCILGLLVFNSTAIAEEVINPCGFIESHSESEHEKIFYINPREISHLAAVYDSVSTSTGNSGRYILGIVMNNGDAIRYGSYTTYEYRMTAINYITQKVIKCNER
jgi:hypothetical protein